MRVLMLSSSYPLEEGDWRGSFVRDLGVALMGQGIDVEVAVPAPKDEGFSEPEASQDEPRVYWLPKRIGKRSSLFHGFGMEANLLREPLEIFTLPPFLVAFALETSLRVLFADCIMAHWLFPMGLVGAVLARFSKKPLIVVCHSAPPIGSGLPALREAIRFVAQTAKTIVCVSERVKDAVAGVVGPGLAPKVVYMPLGIDLKPHARYPVSGESLRVLFVGRLIKNKGVDVLLDALSHVHGVTTTVIGDGPQAQALRDRAARTGLNVRFMGERKRSEVEAAMLSHDVLVVPSRRGWFGREEGMPRVIVESWSCGLPVIASRVGGIPQALAEGGGILVVPGDVVDLARAIHKVAEDASLLRRLRDEATTAAERYSWHVLGPKWARLLL